MRYSIVEAPNDLEGVRTYGIYNVGDEPSWPSISWKSTAVNKVILWFTGFWGIAVTIVMLSSFGSDVYRGETESMVMGTTFLLALIGAIAYIGACTRPVREMINSRKRLAGFTVNRYGRTYQSGFDEKDIPERIFFVHSRDAYRVSAESAIDSWLDINDAYTQGLIGYEARIEQLEKVRVWLGDMMDDINGIEREVREIHEDVLSEQVDMSVEWIKD